MIHECIMVQFTEIIIIIIIYAVTFFENISWTGKYCNKMVFFLLKAYSLFDSLPAIILIFWCSFSAFIQMCGVLGIRPRWIVEWKWRNVSRFLAYIQFI